MKNSVAVDHDSARFLAQSPAILKVLAKAHCIKTDKVRNDVIYILSAALINANDSMHDTSAREQLAFAEPKDFWSHIFRASAQSLSCERDCSRFARTWLSRHGLAG